MQVVHVLSLYRLNEDALEVGISLQNNGRITMSDVR